MLNVPVISSVQYSEFNIKLDTSKPFCLLLIKIDNFDAFCSKYNQEDRSLMKFGISNIAEELLSKYYSSESADMGANTLLVLMNKSDDTPIIDILTEIQENVQNHLELSITIAAGKPQRSVLELADEYQRVVKASEYRMISGHGSIILADDVFFKSATDFTYPDDKEKDLIEALMLGQTDNANIIFKDVIAYSAMFGRSTLDACLLSLLLAINNAILVIERNSSMISIHFSFDEFVDRIRQVEMLDEYYGLFFNLFTSLSLEMEDSRKNRHEKLIEQVISIIEEKYALQNLCLDDISDIVKVSPYYLTKLFKKYKLISISDYIHKVRLEKAKTMIQQEDIPIRLVMERTGFTSRSHFYTLFRKVYGVSPNQFRNIV